MNKVVHLVICLLLVIGCTGPYPDRRVNYSYKDIKGNEFKRITVVPGAVRTVCIQPDLAQPELTLVVKPLEEKLAARGYKIVASPDEAVHTMHLHLNAFGTETELKPSENGSMVPNVGYAAGTAIGGAVSGSALHAATTTGGAIGGVTGLVLGTLLSAGSKPKGPLFYTEVDVRISDPVSGEQHTARGKVWRLLQDYHNPEVRQKVNQMAADTLADKVAALMP